MSIKVTLPAAFTRHTDGRKHFDSAAGNLPGLLADIDQTYPALATQNGQRINEALSHLPAG